MPHKANSTFKENIKWVVKFPNVLLGKLPELTEIALEWAQFEIKHTAS